MKKVIYFVITFFGFYTTSFVFADDVELHETAKPLSFNLAVVSDYRFRGISQTRFKPALQGSVDYVDSASGLYTGAWLSNIKWVQDAGGKGNMEWDVYAGKKGKFSEQWSYDGGLLYCVYPSNDLHPNANTVELYGQLSYDAVYVKYSHAVTNLFGVADSKNSGYLDIGANVDIGDGVAINLHAGHQMVKNNASLSYNDFKIGVTKDFGILSASLAVVVTDTKAYVGPEPELKDLGKTGLLVSLSKTF